MRYALLFLALIVFSGEAFSKGASGVYYIKGIAFGTRGEVLACSELQLKFGNRVSTIHTNEKGEYEIEIFWLGPCPSVKHPPNYNPRYIDISFGKNNIRLINSWWKYRGGFNTPKEKVTRMCDLHFH